MKNKGHNNCDRCGGSVRALAASAGIQFGDLQTEAYRLREKLGPDHQKAITRSFANSRMAVLFPKRNNAFSSSWASAASPSGPTAKQRSSWRTRRVCINAC